MPTGVYVRTKPKTEKFLSAARENVKKAAEVAHKLPRTLAQIDNTYRMGQAPKSEKQIEASRENGRKNGLSCTGKPHPHGPTVFGDDIIEHHNDLCHGAERPDDVTSMTSSEHMKFHAGYQERDNEGKFI